MLWGELVQEPQTNRATLWYRRALEYLPGYVKARVHLAEIHAASGRAVEAEALLMPVLASGDPEVRWRLADVLAAQNRLGEAEVQLDAARSRFEDLLGRHPLAFADHAAEFYAGTGNEPGRAFALARMNVANRPTRRAIERAYEIALKAGEVAALSGTRAGASELQARSSRGHPAIDPVSNVGAAS
jgi:hypothetical protein